MLMLSTREKVLLAVLVVLLLGLGLYYGGSRIHAHVTALEKRTIVRQAMLERTQALHAELRRQRTAQVRTPVRSGSLIAYVEQFAERIGVKDRVQLNLLPREANGDLQGLDVKVDRLTLDELVQLLYTLEDAEQRLVIDQLELSPSFRDKQLLRLSMRILAPR